MFDETCYFVDAMVRLDRIRVIGVPLQKFFFVARQTKKVIFFFNIFGFRVMDFAFAVVKLFGRVVGLTRNAVIPTINVNFNIAGVVTGLQQFLYANFVAKKFIF